MRGGGRYSRHVRGTAPARHRLPPTLGQIGLALCPRQIRSGASAGACAGLSGSECRTNLHMCPWWGELDRGPQRLRLPTQRVHSGLPLTPTSPVLSSRPLSSPVPPSRHPFAFVMVSAMAFMTPTPLLRGGAATYARSVGVSSRRAPVLPARAARRSRSTGVSMVGGSLNDLLSNNLDWSKRMTSDDPDYFQNLVAMQQPDYLWIGCTCLRRARVMRHYCVVPSYCTTVRDRCEVCARVGNVIWQLPLTVHAVLLSSSLYHLFHIVCVSQARTLACQRTSLSGFRLVRSSCTATLRMWLRTRYVAFILSLLSVRYGLMRHGFLVRDGFCCRTAFGRPPFWNMY